MCVVCFDCVLVIACGLTFLDCFCLVSLVRGLFCLLGLFRLVCILLCLLLLLAFECCFLFCSSFVCVKAVSLVAFDCLMVIAVGCLIDCVCFRFAFVLFVVLFSVFTVWCLIYVWFGLIRLVLVCLRLCAG